MINLRYHIVSITAVFLALGIGLTLGSTFLDRVTVDNLKSQLDDVQARVNETQAANDELENRTSALEERDTDLAAQLPERTLSGHLEDVPVLVIASSGTDESLVDGSIQALSGAGSDMVGTWWLTDRWLLDDAEEVEQLGEILDLDTDDAGRLRRNAAIRIADVLVEASQPATDPSDDLEQPDQGDGSTTTTTTTTTASIGDDATGDEAAGVDTGLGQGSGDVEPPAPEEPELLAELQEAGFVDYEPAPGSDSERILLPAAEVRYLFVGGTGPDTGPHLFELALLQEMSGDAIAPAVAVQGEVEVRDGEDLAPEADRRTTFVGPLRDGELTGERVSTVDNVDSASGLVALVLALEDLTEDELRVGHYGVGPGAARLLPGTEPA